MKLRLFLLSTFLISFTIPCFSSAEKTDPSTIDIENSYKVLDRDGIGRFVFKKQNIFAFFGIKKDKPHYIGKIIEIREVSLRKLEGKLAVDVISNIDLSNNEQHSVDLKPGFYEIKASCSNSARRVRPSSVFELKAGQQKERHCVNSRRKTGEYTYRTEAVLRVKKLSKIN